MLPPPRHPIRDQVGSAPRGGFRWWTSGTRSRPPLVQGTIRSVLQHPRFCPTITAQRTGLDSVRDQKGIQKLEIPGGSSGAEGPPATADRTLAHVTRVTRR